MSAIERAFASNETTPLITLEFTDGSTVLRLVQAYYDLEDATLEDSTTATFTAAGFNVSLPARSTDGMQDLEIGLDNTDNTAWTTLKGYIDNNRTSEQKVTCILRFFIESDTSSPAGEVVKLTVLSSSVNRNSVTIRAGYSPLPDTQFPRLRYYPTNYPGLKYV